MKRTDILLIVVYVYRSRQNGLVLDVRGLCPTIGVGQHAGVEPKIRVLYETK